MEKLGPCPLCGGEAIHEEINTMAPEIAQCEHDGCEMANWMAVETWQKLSALAASEKRLKAEVERLIAENAKLDPDAKLGRMVRAMPEDMALTPGFKSGNEPPWLCFWGDGERYSSSGCTPEEALAAAGVKG